MCLTFRQLVGGARVAATCLPRGKAQPCQLTVPWVVGTWGQGLLEEEEEVRVEWEVGDGNEGPGDEGDQ